MFPCCCRLNGGAFDSVAAQELGCYLERAKDLLTLDLTRCRLVDGSAVMNICKSLRANRTIIQLILVSTQLDSLGIKV